MGRLLDEDDVIDAINKRISVLQKHPEFRRKHADIDLYGIKTIIADIQPAAVRCKNCKHYKTTGNFKAYCDEENFPDEGQKELPEWWFCAGGKPYKEGKQDDYERKDISLDTDDIFDAELAKRILNNK